MQYEMNEFRNLSVFAILTLLHIFIAPFVYARQVTRIDSADSSMDVGRKKSISLGTHGTIT